MNAPWYPPDAIDWQDGLNPLALPAFRAQRNPYVYRALQHPTMVELRAAAAGYELALWATPEESAGAIGPGSTYDALVTVPAGAWLYGLSATSVQPEGFLAQVTLPAGTNLFAQAVSSAALQARPYYLSKPLGFPESGGLRLRIVNQSGSPNVCQLVAWVMIP